MLKTEHKVVNKIIETLLDYDIEVFDCYVLDGKTDYLIICSSILIVFETATNIIKISFHVLTKPEESARCVLLLKTIKNVKDCQIMDSFIYNNENQLLSGNDAFELAAEEKKNSILKNFVNEQMQIHQLYNVKGYEC